MPRSSITGCILGTAIGDALGLPYEGLSRRRGVRLLGEPDRYRFLLGRGMISDDTEHTCLAAEALIASGGDPGEFERQLARRLRWWLLTIPAGLGGATLRAVLKLWLGFPPGRSGVFSAGNGPSMRSAILGAAATDLEHLASLVSRSTRLTHSDPKAEHGALAVALAARHAAQGFPVAPDLYLRDLALLLPREAHALLRAVTGAADSAGQGETTVEYAAAVGLEKGVSGYTYHTVPVALHAWLRHGGDLGAALRDVIRCGGDTDSVGAIVGGLIGAGVGRQGIPPGLLSLAEWPRTVAWMERLGGQLERVRESRTAERSQPLPALWLLARNLFFLVMIVLHVLRRLLPPY